MGITAHKVGPTSPGDIARAINSHKSLRIIDIAEHIAEVTGVPVYYMKMRNRRRDMVMARYLFFWVATRRNIASMVKLGQFLNREHGTVVHAVKKIQDEVDLFMQKGIKGPYIENYGHIIL